MAEPEVQRAILAACFGTQDVRSKAQVAELLSAHGVASADAEAMAGNPRFWLYRRLVRANMFDIIGRMMPTAKERMNLLAAQAFDETITQFLADVAPRTHHFRDVPIEFFEWAKPRWTKDSRIPAYLVDLAAYELLEFAVGVGRFADEVPAVGEIAVDRALVFSSTVQLCPLAHPVHALPDDMHAPVAPRDVTLLVYRDAEHMVRFLELSPLVGTLAERLLGGVALGEALQASCAAHAQPLGQELLGDVAKLLADWGERGILLGARA
jgi:hypothetical protein